MAYAYVSTRIVTPEGERDGALLVEDGRIAAVCGRGEIPAGAMVRDFGTAAILPGLVDAHTHINEPGRTEWEGFETATRAAAAGGFTTLVDMPLNCLPETTNVAALEAKRAAAAGKCMVDWAAWGGVVGSSVADGNRVHLLPLAEAGVRGYKCFLVDPGCEGFRMVDLAELGRAAPLLAESGLPLLVHAELQGPIDEATERLEGRDWRKYATYLASRPDEAELHAIAAMLELCRKHRFRLHIVHLATMKALEMLRAAKAEGLPVTVESCPHYLHFAAEEIADGATAWKCAPPIRSAANREGLWAGLREGVIDLVATDHSPCPPEMKRLETGAFNRAWGGIAGLQAALPVMWTECVERGLKLNDLARWMSAAPARLAGLQERAGALRAGRDANFVVLDAEAEFEMRAEALLHRHKVSPYVGERLRGVVRATYLRGECVYEAGKIVGSARGREVRV